MGFKKPILNWKIGVSIIDIVLTPFLLFGFWIIEFYGDFTFGKYTFEGWCWATGLSFAYTYNSFLNLLSTPKWNKINRKRCRRNIFYGTIITSQSVMTYYTGGGFSWTDIILGLGTFIILANFWKYLSKIIPRQKDVQMIDWLLDNYKMGTEDGVLNPIYLIKHHIASQKKESGADIKIDDQSCTLIKDKVVIDYCNQVEDIIERLIKMHRLSKDDE